jgi:hypothetical protein
VRLLPAIGSNHFFNSATSLEGFTAQSQSQGGYLLLNCKGKSFNLVSKGHFAAILVIELRRLWNIDPRPIGLTPA